MRILKIDQKNNSFKVVPDNLDDLWHLERLIEEHDVVSGKAERKVKPKEEGLKASKENIFVELDAERIEFHESSGNLRVLGVVMTGKPEEYVELKSHHALEVVPGKEITVKKKALKNYQIERLHKAKRAAGRVKTLLVVLDDEEAEFALLKEFDFEPRGRLIAGKHGKRFKDEEKENHYFEKIISKIEEIKPEKIVFAGPGFTKNNLEKYLEEKGIKLNAFFEQINSVGISGLNELLKSGILERIVEETQLAKETKLVERVFEELGKGKGLAAASLKETENAIDSGAISALLVSDEFLLSNRKKAEELLERAEKLNGEIHIVSVKNDAGRKLKGIGGVAALLRYAVRW
ncbi:MAG: protein pelota [archaeon GW2011_AR10]|uniref:Protein pelota homolog n=1 Tax=Candidatus Iainarchaeum sp. TaxID=3101447 RepID=A0A7J4IRP5_9ARCH|nr:MAG: protein pelota [archaeon GW2011_AR10]HIH08183.1 mRNA surveillance protein pelota [Candidatus Diapherotrites archaeon]